MDQPLRYIPPQITAGDTAFWTRALCDYPAGLGWSLVYTLVSRTKAYTFVGTANGDTFDVTVAASDTAGWDVDTYRWAETVSMGGNRHTTAIGTLRVLPNLGAATGGIDTRTHARKMLDLIEAWLESRAPTVGSMEIAGRKIANYPLPDIIKLRDRYRFETAREEAGRGVVGTRILVRL